ncbi:MAG: porin [Sideroxydans sp.]|nr:porin [Sideroxydans sp.]
MQKKIIALAVAAAFSTPAFADVGFYGIVDAAVAAISASGQKSDLLATSGAASQSRIGVKATEDIGNGLTAVAVLEYGLDAQTSTGLSAATARQQMLAVAGDFGTVATGYLQTAAYDFLAKYDPIYGSGSSAHSIVAKGHLVGNGGQRAQRAIAYLSPNINGMTFAVNYATALAGLGNLTVDSAATTGLKSTAVLLSANYAVDALSVGAVYAKTGNDNTTGTAANIATTSEFAIGGSYDLGVAKLMGTYQSSKSTNLAKNDLVYSLAAVMPVSTGAFAVMYGANKNQEASSGSASAITAGYLHTFTKSTTGYVVVSSVKNGSATSAYSVSGNALAASTAPSWVAGGGSSSLVGVGLRKKF